MNDQEYTQLQVTIAEIKKDTEYLRLRMDEHCKLHRDYSLKIFGALLTAIGSLIISFINYIK